MQTARDKIRELRALHEDGLLSQQEFDSRKNAILDAEYAPPGSTATPVTPPIHIKQGTEIGLMAGQEIGPQNRRGIGSRNHAASTSGTNNGNVYCNSTASDRRRW